MSANNSFFATVGMLPVCDFCKAEGKSDYAYYDFKTKHGGNWANACEYHYEQNRLFDVLGEGKGQILCIPRPGSMIGARIQLMPISRRAVYKPAYLFVVEEDNRGWRGLSLSDRGQPTNSTLFPYGKELWRDARNR